jgi:hypothetical protein
MDKPRANGGILGNGLHGEKEAVRLKADRIKIKLRKSGTEERFQKSTVTRSLLYSLTAFHSPRFQPEHFV